MANIHVRTGATLTLLCTKRDPAGVEESVASIGVSATFTEQATGRVLAIGSVNKGVGGQFTINLDAGTTAAIGPAGTHCNIKYTYDSGVVDIVDPFPVEIRR